MTKRSNLLLLIMTVLALTLVGCTPTDDGAKDSPMTLPADEPVSSGASVPAVETAPTARESTADISENKLPTSTRPVTLTFTDVNEVVYTTSNVNVRTGPGTGHSVATVVAKDSPVKRTGYSDTWSRVEIADTVYYMSSAYLSVTAPQKTETAAAVSDTGSVYGDGEITIAIDAGHQRKGNSEKEPLGPGAAEKKAKVTGGATGVATGQAEYELNLSVSLQLRDELVSRGYQVVMIRESHDVNLSNKERADIANDSGAQAFIRIHGNSANAGSAHGALTMCPTANNPYVSSLHEKSLQLSQNVLDQFCASTGAKNRGVTQTDSMSGINWAKIPVTIVEMGFLSNADEDRALADSSYQDKMAKGIADGIDNYFGK